MLKDFDFPELEPEKNRKRPLSEALGDDAETLQSVLVPEQRFVSVDIDGRDIDIAQFPALRAALGITEVTGNDAVPDAYADEPSGGNGIADNEPEEDVPEEEPVPSLFAGIGRTDWSKPVEKKPGEEKHIEFSDDDSLPLEVIEAGPDEDAEEEKEPEICEFDLLDMIDDIEFSDLGPEALKPVQIKQLMSDPYNSRFNSADEDDDGDEPDEMPVSSKFIFEKK